MTTDTQAPSGTKRWGFSAPVNPTVAPEHRESFFTEALAGTVIEVWDDLYKRSPSGHWIHLEDLVYSGGAYSDHREHNSSTAEELTKSMGSEFTTVTVLRLGAEALWS